MNMADRGIDRGTVRNVGQPRDAGRTSGGGSLGHDQPKDPADPADLRNQRRDDRGDKKDDGVTKDPVMPDNDSTLNTKI
jgi:hypothetical protein